MTAKPIIDDHTDRSMNVVISGIDENRDINVWRDIVTRSLQHAAGAPVDVVDAFRLGRFTNNGKNRPILVKLSSIWHRRLLMAGARKLRDVPELRKVNITADEAPEVRRRNTLYNV